MSMKTLFRGYYALDPAEEKALWKKAIFALDTNVLLNFYKYSESTRKSWMVLVKKIRKRLFIPHQVGLEFQRNRLEVIASEERLFDSVGKALTTKKREVADLLKASMRFSESEVNEWTGALEEAFKKISAGVSRHKSKHPKLRVDDTIREEIDGVFGDCVGPAFKPSRLKEIYEEGASRYESQIPPGFRDQEKPGARKYGDLVIWFEMIQLARNGKKPIIFVTDDQKPDWWNSFEGARMGPHPTLIQEMRDNSGQGFFIYTPEEFFLRARKELGLQKSTNAAKETAHVSQTNLDYTRAARLAALRMIQGEAESSMLKRIEEAAAGIPFSLATKAALSFTPLTLDALLKGSSGVAIPLPQLNSAWMELANQTGLHIDPNAFKSGVAIPSSITETTAQPSVKTGSGVEGGEDEKEENPANS